MRDRLELASSSTTPASTSATCTCSASPVQGDPHGVRPDADRHRGRLGDRSPPASALVPAGARRASRPRSPRASRRASSPPGARRSRARSRPRPGAGVGRSTPPFFPTPRRPVRRSRGLDRPGAARDRSSSGARRAPPRRTRRSAASSSRSTRRTPPSATPSARSATRCWARVFNGIELDLDETYEWGWDELHRIEHAMGARSASGSSPASRVDAVIELPRDRPDARDRGRRRRSGAWIQDLLDRTVAELDGVHFDIPEPVQRVEAMIAPPGGAAAMYYTGPSRGLQPARAAPGTRRWARPASRSGARCRSATTRASPAITCRSRRCATSPTRSAATSARSRDRPVTPRAGRSTPSGSWASSATSTTPTYELGHAARAGDARGARRRRHRHAPRAADPRPTSATTPARRWTPELALPFVIERSRSSPRTSWRSEVDRYLGLPGQAISYKVGERVWLEARDDARRRARRRVRPQGVPPRAPSTSAPWASASCRPSSRESDSTHVP